MQKVSYRTSIEGLNPRRARLEVPGWGAGKSRAPAQARSCSCQLLLLPAASSNYSKDHALSEVVRGF